MMKKLSTIIFSLFFLSPQARATEDRVIALSPALTELIYAVKLEKALVGVSDFSDYPSDAKNKKSVGPYTKPNLEVMYSLKPTLVLLPVEGPADVKTRLDQMHVKYTVIDMRKLSDIGEAAQLIGKLLGAKKEGDAFKSRWERDLKTLFEVKATRKIKPRTFIELQKNPLIAAGQNTFLDEIVSRCGGVNTVSDFGYPKLSLEWASSQTFDLVLLSDYFTSPAEKDETLKWWRTLPSAQKAKVIALDSDLTSRPGPRLLQGIKLICQAVREVL